MKQQRPFQHWPLPFSEASGGGVGFRMTNLELLLCLCGSDVDGRVQLEPRRMMEGKRSVVFSGCHKDSALDAVYAKCFLTTA